MTKAPRWPDWRTQCCRSARGRKIGPATKSLLAAATGLVALVARWSGDQPLAAAIRRLPPQLRQAFDLDWDAALPLLSWDWPTGDRSS
jgi:hypothetical protein